jgi:hypothetical protein
MHVFVIQSALAPENYSGEPTQPEANGGKKGPGVFPPATAIALKSCEGPVGHYALNF